LKKDKLQKLPSPGGRVIKGRGIKKVIMHPHISLLPSRERGK